MVLLSLIKNFDVAWYHDRLEVIRLCLSKLAVNCSFKDRQN